jgi:hypothetical protein
MAKFKLFPLNTFVSFINCLTLWHNNLTVGCNRTACRFSMNFIFKLPQFNYTVICCEHLQNTLPIINKLNRIYFLIKLNRFKMIEFRFMTLNFSKISIIKVPRVLELIILENNYSASLITNCQILT